MNFHSKFIINEKKIYWERYVYPKHTYILKLKGFFICLINLALMNEFLTKKSNLDHKKINLGSKKAKNNNYS
jgi:hypothetical protein